MNTNKPKIGIDFTYVKYDKVSGVRKHGEELLVGLKKYKEDYEFVIFVDKILYNYYKSEFSEFKIVPIKVLFKNIKYIRGIYNRLIDKKKEGVYYKKGKM